MVKFSIFNNKDVRLSHQSRSMSVIMNSGYQKGKLTRKIDMTIIIEMVHVRSGAINSYLNFFQQSRVYFSLFIILRNNV